MNPVPIILSSPSGGGKTTIARRLLDVRHDVGYSVSCTTRPPREGEVEGRDYYFRSREEFELGRMAGEFAESAEVHGHLYGTLRSEVERVLASGRHVMMDIDVQGARQFQAAFPATLLIFVLPPSARVLLERLEARKTEDARSLTLRLKSAKEELKAVDLYPYVVVNYEVEAAVEQVCRIIDGKVGKTLRSGELERRLSELVAGIDQAIDHYSKRR
ncbi:MAG TPA: guanylate kinase [Gemmatimonadaceae bacterium]|nr:guanylate kinase [Gemmatimonadaceae bacterium]